jgi:hypothetical protein
MRSSLRSALVNGLQEHWWEAFVVLSSYEAGKGCCVRCQSCVVGNTCRTGQSRRVSFFEICSEL